MLRSWLIRLITWDGLFPLAIWSAPFLVAWVLPNKRGAIYYQLLSMVLAFGGRIDEAIPYAQRAVTEFSTVHSPKSKFLARRKAELEDLRMGKVSVAFDF